MNRGHFLTFSILQKVRIGNRWSGGPPEGYTTFHAFHKIFLFEFFFDFALKIRCDLKNAKMSAPDFEKWIKSKDR